MQPRAVRTRLSIMMFLQFYIWGAWYVTAPSFLGKVGFAGSDIGWTYSVGPIAGMISPLFVGMVVDRFFPAQRVLGVLHLLGGALMYLATVLAQGEGASPAAINWVLFGYMLCYFPTLALTNTLAMRNIESTQRDFPRIRVLGTIGWIIAGWTLVAFGWGASVGMFHLAAASGVVLGIYSFTLPHTPPATDEPVRVRQLFGLDAIRLLKDRSFAVFMLCSFLICIPLAFYYQLAERTVQTVGYVDDSAFRMSFGQLSEIFFMAVMPFFFVRLGVKWMLAVGMLAWVVRYGLFAVGAPDEVRWMILAGVILHGICYDFFFVTGQIYTDRFAPDAVRGQAQGLLVLCTLGLGMFIGAQVAGASEDRFTPPAAKELLARVQDMGAEIGGVQQQLDAGGAGNGAQLEEQLAALKDEQDQLKVEAYRKMDWRSIWQWPAVGAAAVMLLFLALFKERRLAAGAPQG